ncbi:pilus assembly protein N-terminal domain-containing protein [Aureimonas sp. AU4]|uniref:pilus assembly protein N-terminal domain-containing protein n=1 Tax=Aureimonas sp. AU4 TaxID=1638163 RepID=UPI00078418B6|nr:pilus assembly protein N-terminal domain-containing protein [Aureimonas sp. AU4]
MRAALFLLAALFAAPAATLAADGPDLRVAIDQARILKIAHPAETVVIGNPAIADVAVHDAQTLVLTGRSYGTTNVVVLGADGAVIMDGQITVGSAEAGTLRIYRQAARTTYACAPQCEPRATIGDTQTSLTSAIGQFTAREGMVAGSAGTSP